MKETPPSADWVHKGVSVRKRSKEQMVSISDIWKAEGSPASCRPDKWFKSEAVQEKLEAIALFFGEGVSRDSVGKIVGIPGVLEIVKGGRYLQGTFVSYDLAIDYTQRLSVESHLWLTQMIGDNSGAESPEVKSDAWLGFPIRIDDFNGEVRFTPDGRVSVYDAIAFVTGISNPRDTWDDLKKRVPEVVGKTDNFQFPGKGQRPTPVTDLQGFGEIVVLLPGKVAAAVREKAVRTLIRAMKGDPTLIEEILDRIQNPEDLWNIEENIRARRTQAYDSDIPMAGTIDNPLTEVTSEIKSGYGWENRTKQMTDWLAELAMHRGMFILRESPHRAYSSTGRDKSRRIDLVLRTMENQETLHIYQFESTYIDDSTVVEAFAKRAYPELAHRDFSGQGVRYIVAHLVAPGGITFAGVERLREIQSTLDRKYGGRIRLDAMRLDELVWGEMYPAIEEKHQDASGKFGGLYLNSKIKKLCKQLCEKRTTKSKQPSLQQSEPVQLSLFQ
jgi:hypothetical protein